SYDYIGASRRWYRREVRIVRNNKQIRSYRDAQGFRIGAAGTEGRKLKVRLLDAYIYHYGWVKHPAAQQRKQQSFNRLWHSDEAVRQMVGDSESYGYDGLEPLERLSGTHPAVMQPRIAAANWHFSGDPAQAKWSWKDRMSYFFEQITGWRPGEYRNYKLLDD
ncbi:MAG: glycosyltransferase family 2 protein, partial [Saprospiraceae bacterium]|nr:glycosyltransferase family 2 protein [Saprospiraceae bacterium]